MKTSVKNCEKNLNSMYRDMTLRDFLILVKHEDESSYYSFVSELDSFIKEHTVNEIVTISFEEQDIKDMLQSLEMQKHLNGNSRVNTKSSLVIWRDKEWVLRLSWRHRRFSVEVQHYGDTYCVLDERDTPESSASTEAELIAELSNNVFNESFMKSLRQMTLKDFFLVFP